MVISFISLLTLLGCEQQLTNNTSQNLNPPLEPDLITQIADTLYGVKGESTVFHLSDFFDHVPPTYNVELFSDHVNIHSMGSDLFRVTQPDEYVGLYLIEVVLTNSAEEILEAELTYNIFEEDGEVDNTDDPSPPNGESMVIMPLGDSMTNDSRSRVALWNLLESDKHTIDYVGNQRQSSSIPDPDHEGVGGIKIQGIMDKTESLMRTHKPEYVLLMVGTNDIAWYFDESAEEIAARWNQLIELIFEYSEPGTYIVAATIPPVASKEVGQTGMDIQDRAIMVKEYNSKLRERVNQRRANNDLIVLADMEAALNPSQHLSSDGVHLNEDGYNIMGNVYYESLSKALNEQD